MEFLFLPRSLRNYPGRGIARISCVHWSLRRGTHTQYTPKFYVLQHITKLFLDLLTIIQNYFLHLRWNSQFKVSIEVGIGN